MSPKVVGRYAVAVLGCLVLVLAAVPAASAFRSALAPSPAIVVDPADVEAAERESDRVHHAQFECIRDALAERLPTDRPVTIPFDPKAPEPELWEQRLTELAYPLTTIVDAPGPGITTLTVAVDDTGAGCTGVLLVIEPG